MSSSMVQNYMTCSRAFTAVLDYHGVPWELVYDHAPQLLDTSFFERSPEMDTLLQMRRTDRTQKMERTKKTERTKKRRRLNGS